MKLIALIIFSVVTVNLVFAQSKKDLKKNIIQLENRTNNLESEIINIKNNLSNTTTTLGLVSKNNLDLDILVKKQGILIEKLIKQSDSLLITFNVNKNADFVSTPKNEEDSIVFVIQSYFSRKTWEERLAYVLNPKIVKSFMNDYYTDRFKSNTIKKSIIYIQGENYEVSELFKVVIDGNYILYCKKTVDGFKIDWEATTGHNLISMKTFMAQSNSNTALFRVKAQLGSYYNYNYRDARKTHWNVTISDNHGNFISGCYVSKSSTEGKEIYQILEDGKKHYLILELTRDVSANNSGNIAMITKVIKEGWSND